MQHVDAAKTLAFQVPQTASQLLRLLAHYVWSESPIRPIPVSLVAKLFRQIKYNRHRNAMILPSQRNDRLARFGLHVRSVDDNQLACRQPFRRYKIENIERIVRGRKCFRAKLDLPDPEGPTRATTASSGIVSFIGE
jgi:hypothetical protein